MTRNHSMHYQCQWLHLLARMDWIHSISLWSDVFRGLLLHMFEHSQEHYFTIKVAIQKLSKARMWRKKMTAAHLGRCQTLTSRRVSEVSCEHGLHHKRWRVLQVFTVQDLLQYLFSSNWILSQNVVQNAKTSQQTTRLLQTICICEQNRCIAMLAKPDAPWIEVVVF